MSDPAKYAGDIDDVLSSIRRLVAEQPGSVPQMRERPAARPATDGKLVLTPALRVSEPEEAVPAPDQEVRGGPEVSETAPEGGEAGPIGEALLLRRDVFQRETAEDADQDGAEPETAEVPAFLDPEAPGAVFTQGDDETAEGSDEVVEEAQVLEAREALEGPAASEPAAEETEETVSEEVITGDVHSTHGALEDDTAEADADALDALSGKLEATGSQLADKVEATQTDPDEAPDEGAADEELAAVEVSDSALGAEELAPAGDVHEPSRTVGGDGWRPEMRLFDWDKADVQDDEENFFSRSAEFESDTGDANWPDDGANRALLDLAAAREAAASGDDDADAATRQADTSTGFKPMFSRRSSGLAPVKAVTREDESGVREAAPPAPVAPQAEDAARAGSSGPEQHEPAPTTQD
ncbi:MAG: hypothetical protein ACOCTP_05575, partial [Roseicyclus sp.]